MGRRSMKALIAVVMLAVADEFKSPYEDPECDAECQDKTDSCRTFSLVMINKNEEDLKLGKLTETQYATVQRATMEFFRECETEARQESARRKAEEE